MKMVFSQRLKKALAVCLSLTLAFSMTAAGVETAKAESVPETATYYFLAPDNYCNPDKGAINSEVGIWYWGGTASPDIDGYEWPGPAAKAAPEIGENVYKYTVKGGATGLIWNAYVDPGEDKNMDPELAKAAHQTRDINLEGYDEDVPCPYDDSYTVDNFDGMIFVLNFNLDPTINYNGAEKRDGAWFSLDPGADNYYKKNAEYYGSYGFPAESDQASSDSSDDNTDTKYREGDIVIADVMVGNFGSDYPYLGAMNYDISYDPSILSVMDHKDTSINYAADPTDTMNMSYVLCNTKSAGKAGIAGLYNTENPIDLTGSPKAIYRVRFKVLKNTGDLGLSGKCTSLTASNEENTSVLIGNLTSDDNYTSLNVYNDDGSFVPDTDSEDESSDTDRDWEMPNGDYVLAGDTMNEGDILVAMIYFGNFPVDAPKIGSYNYQIYYNPEYVEYVDEDEKYSGQLGGSYDAKEGSFKAMAVCPTGSRQKYSGGFKATFKMTFKVKKSGPVSAAQITGNCISLISMTEDASKTVQLFDEGDEYDPYTTIKLFKRPEGWSWETDSSTRPVDPDTDKPLPDQLHSGDTVTADIQFGGFPKECPKFGACNYDITFNSDVLEYLGKSTFLTTTEKRNDSPETYPITVYANTSTAGRVGVASMAPLGSDQLLDGGFVSSFRITFSVKNDSSFADALLAGNCTSLSSVSEDSARTQKLHGISDVDDPYSNLKITVNCPHGSTITPDSDTHEDSDIYSDSDVYKDSDTVHSDSDIYRDSDAAYNDSDNKRDSDTAHYDSDTHKDSDSSKPDTDKEPSVPAGSTFFFDAGDWGDDHRIRFYIWAVDPNGGPTLYGSKNGWTTENNWGSKRTSGTKVEGQAGILESYPIDFDAVKDYDVFVIFYDMDTGAQTYPCVLTKNAIGDTARMRPEEIYTGASDDIKALIPVYFDKAADCGPHLEIDTIGTITGSVLAPHEDPALKVAEYIYKAVGKTDTTGASSCTKEKLEKAFAAFGTNADDVWEAFQGLKGKKGYDEYDDKEAEARKLLLSGDSEDPTKDDTDSGRLLGDIDDDGMITSADALSVLRNSLGLDEFDDAQKIAADIDKDSMITSADALEILRYSLGISSSYKVGVQI